MPAFSPDIEKLLSHHEIHKPNEQFVVGSIPPDPTDTPEPINKTDFDIPQQPLTIRLEDEASKTQDILDILIDTTPQVSVPIPQEHHSLMGTAVTTADYVNSLESNDLHNNKRQEHFEWGVLTDSNDISSWPILMAPDLIDIRDSLLSARDMIEGTLLSDTLKSENWKDSVLASDLSLVHESLIRNAQEYRFKVAQGIFTHTASLESKLLNHLLSPAIQKEVAQIRGELQEVIKFLGKIRSVLKHAQLLLAFEHIRSRKALLNIAESAVISTLTNILIVKLSDLIPIFVNPILDKLDRKDHRGHSLLDKLEDSVSNQIVSVVAGTIQAIVLQYKNTAADFIRENNNKSKLQLDKLQSLGEKNIIGRWIIHIDQILTELNRIINDPGLSQDLTTTVISKVIKPPAPPKSALLERALGHPELQQAQSIALEARTFGITQQLDPESVPKDQQTQPTFESNF